MIIDVSLHQALVSKTCDQWEAENLHSLYRGRQTTCLSPRLRSTQALMPAFPVRPESSVLSMFFSFHEY